MIVNVLKRNKDTTLTDRNRDTRNSLRDVAMYITAYQGS